MKKTSVVVVSFAILVLWLQPANAQSCVLNLSDAPAATAADINNPGPKFLSRKTAAVNYGLCTALSPLDGDCKHNNYGEGYQVWLFSRLASTVPAKQQEAIDSLRNIKRDDFGAMGTNSPLSEACAVSGILHDLLKFLSNAAREGEGDSAMIGFINVLFKYKTLLKDGGVFDHVLSLIDLTPGMGNVETFSFGVRTEVAATVLCPLACAGTGLGYPFCYAGCTLAAATQKVEVPETENHLNLIYISQYLKNQILFEQTGNPKFDNARNGYRSGLINRMKDFVRNDFVEYNAHPYEDYDMFALMPLASYATDPAVKSAATMVLDYLSAKVTVSSNDGRRATPFRRRNEGGYFCDELVQPGCGDPQTAFYMMLAGITDILENKTSSGMKDDKTAPGSYGVEFLWAATAADPTVPTDYHIPSLVLDLLLDRTHRDFYQFFHYARKRRLDDANDSNDELYAGSRSYLISAGGHGNQEAYVADVAFPLSVATGKHPGQDTDLGVAPPTIVMPTGDFHSEKQMIRFDASLCVAPHFACGNNPLLPDLLGNPPGPTGSYKTVDGPTPGPVPSNGFWTFLEYSSPKGSTPEGTYRSYAALYQSALQGGFGFVELYDAAVNPKNIGSLAEFKSKVHEKNDSQTFSQGGVNTYTRVDGTVIRFSVGDGKIVTINGAAPYDPNRTNGTIIDNDGTGLVTIKNPALNKSITLDATITGHPQITVPGPLNFPNTCVGAKSFTDLNVCNNGNGTDNLFVYNITSNNTQFAVTEPTSGYPTTIGSNFCFPFQAQFTPVMTGSIDARLTISNSDPTVPEFRLNVSGTGIQQGIATVISNSGNFGNVCVGSYTDLNLTINNTGGCDLVINNITSSSTDFTVAGALSFPLTIHAGDSLLVPIRFHPSGFGPVTANITVASNDPKMPNAVVPVSGNAPPPVINATIANTGSFGNVCSGTQSDLTLQVINQGLCPLTISGVGSVGGLSFTLPSVTNYPLVVSAGGSANLPIRFQPPAYGSPNYITCSDTVAQTANVVIHSNDPVYPDPTGFVRSVNGIEGCPKLVLSPQNLTGLFAFPATVSDPGGTRGCYTDRQITAGNSGICPLYIVNLTTSNGVDGNGQPLPASPLEFSVMNPTVPVTITPGAAPVPITVRFKPVVLTNQKADVPDQQTGTLTIVSNDPVTANNAAGLCGEPAYQSGARVLVVDSTNTPVSSVDNIVLQSKGMTPPFMQSLKPAPLLSTPNICGNTITYHLDNENLRPAGTTGNDPRASYNLSAKSKSTQANMSFTLGQCQMNQILLQIE